MSGVNEEGTPPGMTRRAEGPRRGVPAAGSAFRSASASSSVSKRKLRAASGPRRGFVTPANRPGPWCHLQACSTALAPRIVRPRRRDGAHWVTDALAELDGSGLHLCVEEGTWGVQTLTIEAADLESARGFYEALAGFDVKLTEAEDGSYFVKLTLGHGGKETRAALRAIERYVTDWTDGRPARLEMGGARYTLDPAVESPTKKPKLVFVHSTRSGQSRLLDAHLAQVLQRRQNHDTFDVIRVDIDQRPRLADRLGVKQTPSLLVIAQGLVVARAVNPMGLSAMT